MQRSNSEGFETGIVKSFSGWDGDIDMMQFYDVEFSCSISTFLPNKIYEGVTVCFTLNNSTVSIFNESGELVYTSKFKIVVC